MRNPAGDAADPHRPGLPGVERVADVVLLQLTGPPARHVEELIVHGQGDVGDQRRDRPEALQQRRQLLGRGRGVAGILMTLVAAHRSPAPGARGARALVPQPDRRGQVLDAMMLVLICHDGSSSLVHSSARPSVLYPAATSLKSPVPQQIFLSPTMSSAKVVHEGPGRGLRRWRQRPGRRTARPVMKRLTWPNLVNSGQ